MDLPVKGNQILACLHIVGAFCFLPGEMWVTQSNAFQVLFIKLYGLSTKWLNYMERVLHRPLKSRGEAPVADL